MVAPRILFVSDDADGRDVWTYTLTRSGFEVIPVATAEEALAWRAENRSQLILIDENNAELDGVGLVETIRPTAAIPILVMTLGDSARALRAYRAGADDCLHKPLLPAIVAAKAQAWLRHSAVIPTALLDRVEQGPIRLLPETQEVETHGRVVSLSNLDFRLLHLLLSHPEEAFSAATLYRRVWGYDDEPDGRTIRAAVYRLRQKVEPDPSQPRHILLIAGEGYLFRP
jgi:two-component system, OmpR family, response regulator RegX3